MKRLASIFLGLVTLFAFAGTASAALRSPQVPVLAGGLQGYLNVADGGINVSTDQQDIQSWQASTGGNTNFTLQLDLGPYSPNNSIGLYNASLAAPPLYQVFPGAAASGWWATAAFRSAPTRVIVTLFDATSAFQGSSTYLGADQANFGFYLMGPGGTFFTQDSRNPGGVAQALTFAGTGANLGSWWLCFEDQPDLPGGGGDSSFDNAVLFLQAIAPVPVSQTTWGQLKARFR
jgi:hypothetical protein